jgi:hypothetical protein
VDRTCVLIVPHQVSCRMTRQGFPAATTFAGRSLTTMLPAPIVLLSPTVTLGQMILPPPIQTLLPMLIGAASSRPESLKTTKSRFTKCSKARSIVPFPRKKTGFAHWLIYCNVSGEKRSIFANYLAESLAKASFSAGGNWRIILPFSRSTPTKVTCAVTYNSLPSGDRIS